MELPHERVVDPSDPRLAPFLGLRDHVLRDDRGPVAAAGRFVAESLLVVERALASGLDVELVVVTPEGLERIGASLVHHPAVTVLVAERAVLAAVAGFDVHRGVLATVRRPPERSVAEVLDGARTIVVLESIVDQANLGAIFRNAAGLGVDGVLLCPRCCDPLYRRSVRVSMGATWHLPWARLDPWPGALASVVQAQGFRCVAFSPTGVPLTPGVPIHRAAGDRYALLFGSEGPGLSQAAIAACDEVVAFPMAGGTDSLNVAAASAVACWAYAVAPGAAAAGGSDGPAPR